MRRCALTLSSIEPHHFTHHQSKIRNLKSQIGLAGLFSVALVVVLFFGKKKTPGRYPARCPSVFGLSSFSFLIEKRLPDSFRLPGKYILARNVQQIQLKFIMFL